MKYLLDTCTMSEFTKRKPDEGVIEWMENIEENELCLSVLTIGEIQKGISKAPDLRRKQKLQVWFSDLRKRFDGRILKIDSDIAITWGKLSHTLESKGTPIPTIDVLLAATAKARNLTVVTRNIDDFAGSGVDLLNSWLN